MMTRNDSHRQSTKLPSKRSRRGVAVIVALGIMAITLAVSYTLLRTQSTARAISANAGRSSAARHASLVGIQVALKRIHDADWEGVTVPITGTVSATDSFDVTFTTGDSQLSTTDPDYGEYPYRLTLQSVGTSIDPADSGRKSEHTTTVVVQLIRERIAAPSADWTTLQNHTLTQWEDTTVTMNFPSRIEGPVRLGGDLSFCAGSPPTIRPFDGLIDEVAILSKSLSASELLDIYNGDATYGSHSLSMRRWWRLDEAAGATVAADVQGFGSGIYEGAEPSAAASPFGGSGSARFDGEVDGIAVRNLDVTGSALTLMAWIKADDFGSSYGRIISKSDDTDESDHVWMLSTTPSGGEHRLRFRLKTLGGSTSTLIASSGDLPTGQWLFAAATFDGLYMRLYLNGVLVGQQLKVGAVDVNPFVTAWIGENAPGSPRGLYFRHLNRMQAAGLNDYRPFDDQITVGSSALTDATKSLLEGELGLTIAEDNTALDYSEFSAADIESYTLYPGGLDYAVTSLGSTVTAQTLEADMVANPLGLFTADADVNFKSNVTLRGTLLASEDVDLDGSGIVIEGVDLPLLSQSTERIQLPAVITADNLEFLEDSAAQLNGMLVVSDLTRFRADDVGMSAAIVGRLVTRRFEIEPRSPWSGLTTSTWNSLAQVFDLQRWLDEGLEYFPDLLEYYGISSQPHFSLVPPTDTVRFHWHDWTQPLFLPANDGDGLRWSIIRWQEDAP